MKANVVFKHPTDPRAVLRVDDDDFYVVMSDDSVDMGQADDIRGDLNLVNVKWLLNLTRGTLININVLGRYVTMRSAIQATTALSAPQN